MLKNITTINTTNNNGIKSAAKHWSNNQSDFLLNVSLSIASAVTAVSG